ncbi:hypothetical protein THIOSC15_520011 [uncultured Thiomicrorhabdus sp.]
MTHLVDGNGFGDFKTDLVIVFEEQL